MLRMDEPYFGASLELSLMFDYALKSEYALRSEKALGLGCGTQSWQDNMHCHWQGQKGGVAARAAYINIAIPLSRSQSISQG